MDPEIQFRACTRKKRYLTEAQAKDDVARLWLQGRGHGLKVYRCFVPDQPEHWHIGHIIKKEHRAQWNALNSLLSLTVSIARTTR